MKNFRQYLSEQKKVYSFKIKVAGDLPENFQDNLKKSLEKYQIITLDKMTTPVQESPLDFPELANKEVTIYDLVVEYPITAPEIANFIKDMNVTEECFRVRNSSSPSEYDHRIQPDVAGALLDDPMYTEADKIKTKDYFGDGFNKDFLKELAKLSKERVKESGSNNDPDVLKSASKNKTDKVGVKSAMGS
jgi:hypothetical protein